MASARSLPLCCVQAGGALIGPYALGIIQVRQLGGYMLNWAAACH